MEALIGLGIFSAGVFALIAMQAVAIGSVSDAKYRSEATLLAGQLVSQMWNDRANLSDYAFNGTGPVPIKLSAWNTAIAAGLPGLGSSSTLPSVILSPSGTTTEVIITVRWQPKNTLTVRQHKTVTYISPP